METGSNNITKIAIVGPECTGKTDLAEALAQYYQTIYVPEFARQYCEEIEHDCTIEDEINIFRGQIALEHDLLKKAQSIVFCDTTFLTVKVWCDYVFKHTPQEVLDALQTEHHYDYFLLTAIDLPWAEDPLRNFPEPAQRQHFMSVWEKELKEMQVPYTIIEGVGHQRIENAIAEVDKVLGE